MGTLAPEMPASPQEGFVADLAGMPSFLMDPAAAARRVHRKWFWIAPLIVFSIISVIAGYLLMPIARHAMEVAPLPPGTTPEQFQQRMQIGSTIQRITLYVAPLMTALFFTIQSAILLATCAITAVGAKFRQLFNLVAGCSLIQMLSSIAGVIILKSKGEVSSMAELRPALGLDIFLPAGTNRFLAAFLGYFSVFEIWWIVMMTLIFSLAFKVSKGKAFLVILPLVLLSILLRLGGASFQQ